MIEMIDKSNTHFVNQHNKINTMNRSSLTAFTNSSKVTLNSRNFRVIMKKRNNPKQTCEVDIMASPSKYIQEENRSESQRLVNKNSAGEYDHKSERSGSVDLRQKDEMTVLKQYVKNHIKTQTNDRTHTLKSRSEDQILAARRQLERIKKSETLRNAKNIQTLEPLRIDPSKIKIPPVTTRITQQSELLNMEYLQRKVDDLIDVKLKNFSQTYDIHGNSNQTLDQELSLIIKEIREIKEDENPQNIEDDISLLNRKIRILQKVMAQSSTEAEMLKKYYQFQVARNSHKRSLSQSSQSFYRMANLQKVEKKQTHYRIKSITGETTSKSSYRRPDKKAYNIYKYKNDFFNAERHRQPLHRSSYNRQYLVYGVQHTQNCKPHDNDCFTTNGNPGLSTSYRESFKEKKAQPLNYRELDCFRDKFKNLPVTFGKKQKDQLANKQYLKMMKMHSDSLAEEKANRGRLKTEHYLKDHLLSESRREFPEGRQTGIEIKSNIKHQSLSKLKYQFKQKMNA